jgi:DNA-binding PadR family transcriptional regulator
LRAAGLVAPTTIGRHRAYHADAGRVKPLLDALYATGPAAVLKPSPRATRERGGDTPLRRARTCYDHLAGVAGVGLLEAMEKRGWLRTEPGPGYALTTAGTRALERRGVAVDVARVSRRRFAPACLDWTERRPHLGGALGAAVLGALRRRGYVRRRARGRAVRIARPLTTWLGR